MISELKPYAKYKASGLPWLGDAPAHWETRRTKFLFRERTEKGHPDEPLLAATQSKGVVKKTDYETRTVTAQKDFHLLKLVEVRDFVISLRSFQGGLEIAHSRGIISPAYTILKSLEGVDTGYFRYFFKSPDFIRSLSLFVTGIREGQNIDYVRLSRAYMPLPPPNEQAAIVKFLDWANSRIDRAIRAKRKVIALLNEQKQAIIHRAVTRGIDPKVELKPSGEPWLGEIPNNWKVLRAKYLFKEVNERSSTGKEELLSVSHITGVTPRSQKNITMFKAQSYLGHKLCRQGDLVINTMWAWMAALGVSKFHGIISPAYAVYRPKATSPLSGDYADLLLRTRPYIANYMVRSTGVRASRLRLYPEQFFRIPIILPPEHIQAAIVSSVRENTKEFDYAILKSLREIELLTEYRTKIVSDVVTGKLDVTAAAMTIPSIDEPVLEKTDFMDANDLEYGAEITEDQI